MAESPGALRLRVQFTKESEARFLSHAEYTRTLMISARRARLPLDYAGRNMGRMKVSLSPPLPIGIASDCEIVDFGLRSYLSAEEARARLADSLPGGIGVVRARLLDSEARPAGKIIDTATYLAVLPPAAAEGAMRSAVERFISEPVVEYERVQPRRTRTVDLRAGTHRLVVRSPEGRGAGPGLEMVLDDGIAGTVKPREVIEVLAGMAGLGEETYGRAELRRTGLFARRGERLVSPMDIKTRSAAGRGAGGARY